ncbi:MAG TPA: hypothetical protein VGL92_12385 [Acidimicrobiia bacterium]|jgi:hypothetical protein
MRNALVAAAKGSVALALLVPLGGAAASASVPVGHPVLRDCSKENNPSAMVCRSSEEAKARLDQLMKSAPHPGK